MAVPESIPAQAPLISKFCCRDQHPPLPLPHFGGDVRTGHAARVPALGVCRLPLPARYFCVLLHMPNCVPLPRVTPLAQAAHVPLCSPCAA